MDTQNITLSLPREVLRQVKIIAVQKDTSVSRLLTDMLEDLIIRETGYSVGRDRHLALLQQGIDLGTQGNIRWQRDDIHAR